MSLTLLLFSLMIFHQSICTYSDTNACKISSTQNTNVDYLSQKDEDENTNILKCFALSETDINPGECCYYKDSDDNKQYCVLNGSSVSNPKCPSDSDYKSDITNNCGMALYYQPQSREDCTDISLVDGFCCYVQTKNNGAACVRQEELDEHKKNKITDEMRKAVNKLKSSSVGDVEIDSVECEGYYMTFYGLSFLLLSVML